MDTTTQTGYLLLSVIWMSWNVFLAGVAILMGQLIARYKTSPWVAALLITWLLFLPNTLYMITDGMYVFYPEFAILTGPHLVLGVLFYATIVALAPYTFVHAILPVIRAYQSRLSSLPPLIRYLIALIFGTLIGIGITMGRFARTNSWHVITQPIRVIEDLYDTVRSPELASFLIIFSAGAVIITALVMRRVVEDTPHTKKRSIRKHERAS